MSHVLHAKDPSSSGQRRFQRRSKGVPKIKILLPLKAFRAHKWAGSHIQSSAEREKDRSFEGSIFMTTGLSVFDKLKTVAKLHPTGLWMY